jgi:hypothetical protein
MPIASCHSITDCPLLSGCGLYLGRPFHANIKDLASDLPILNSVNNIAHLWTAVTSQENLTQDVQRLLINQNTLMESSIALHMLMSSLGHHL